MWRGGLIVALVLLVAPNAMAMDLQLSIAPLAGQVPAEGEHHLATGFGFGASYTPLHRRYTLDMSGHCMWSVQEFGYAIDSRPVEIAQQVRLCDVVVGASYRLGYPFAVRGSSRFGFALGLGAGLRRADTLKKVATMQQGHTANMMIPEPSYGLVLWPRIAVEYNLGGLSVGGYTTAAATYKSDIIIGVAAGLFLAVNIQV